MNTTRDAATDAPSRSVVDPDESSNSDFVDNDQIQFRWLIFMGVGLVVFLLLPLVTSKHRRKLWWRRIRECRWIEDTGRSNEWYVEAHNRRQERRRRLESEQQRFRMSRTQEDEIREHFLLEKMENYTISLSNSDLFERDMKNRPGSKTAVGPEKLEQTKTEDLESWNGSLDVSSSRAKDDVENSMFSEIVGEIECFDFEDTDGYIRVPLPGMDSNTEKTRSVPNGCSICLGPFTAEEKVTWSSNNDCSHTFHHECLMHWFLTVGRKTQTKWYRQNPNRSEKDALDKLCRFPMLCPCCRQQYYPKVANDGDPEKEENVLG